MNVTLLGFIYGAVAMGSFIAALFFARFARESGDRLFRSFSLAFLLLGTERVVMIATSNMREVHPALYLLRCVAFLVIIRAVWVKNSVPASAAAARKVVRS